MTWVADAAHITGCIVTIAGAVLVYLGHSDGIAIAAIGAGLAGGTDFFKTKRAGISDGGKDEKNS